MSNKCADCQVEPKCTPYGEWSTTCYFCRDNPEIGINEYDSHFISREGVHIIELEEEIKGYKTDLLDMRRRNEELESINIMNNIKIEQYEIQIQDLLDKIIAFGSKKTFNKPKKLDQYLGD